ncbi:helix-turn-helix domain-containing protein [Nocardia sp. alder85J]|uniref:helix-turn-helix domain-containing protein n=1 Tax=Nocardia sp. alder85J TaxID=2862949 RepID=UPI001CD6BE36|nr:helix-turn-helix domain-containing protein [Nocardia sp. alder85J]MCX4097676.1 helix-turn-helix domain-containing protein [Nocardia sp. alder85J]
MASASDAARNDCVAIPSSPASLERANRQRAARVMRSLREAAGLTRPQLGALLGVAPQTIAGMERGRSPVTIDTVYRYYRTPELGMTYLYFEFIVDIISGRVRPVDDLNPPDARKIAFCDQLPGPALIVSHGIFDLGHCNQPGRSWFQGIDEFRNLTVWLMLDPRARDVFGDGWEPIAYMAVLALRHLSIELVGERRRRTVVGAASQAEEFSELWDRRTPVDEVMPDQFTLNNLTTGETADFYFGAWRPYFPVDRDWQQMTFWRV